jgi:hypothetical protein
MIVTLAGLTGTRKPGCFAVQSIRTHSNPLRGLLESEKTFINNPAMKSALFTALGAVLLASSASAVTTTNGDLLIGFYQWDGTSISTGTNTYVFNLGQASIWRENTQVGVSVSTVNGAIASGNIGADLSAAFGTGWFNDPTVRWGIVGGLDQTTVGFVGGERQQTSYVSRPGTSGLVGSTPTTGQDTILGGARNTLRNNIEAFRLGSNGVGTNIGNNSGSLITVNTSLATFEDFVPPTTSSSQFGINQNILQAFGPGTLTGGAEGALDIWRFAGGSSTSELLASGTDLTSGLGAPITASNGLGKGQYIGTITINSTGDLLVVPEPSSALLVGLCGIAGLGIRKRRKNA